jgi:hypothetical protein
LEGLVQVEIRKALSSDIDIILKNCREREREAYHRLGQGSHTYLSSVLSQSAEAFSGLVDGEPCCMWGIVRGSLLSDSAFLWLITCYKIEEYPFTFIRRSQIWLADLRKRYHHIHGVVQADNLVSIKWLKWLGFSVYGFEFIEGYALKRFEMRA